MTDRPRSLSSGTRRQRLWPRTWLVTTLYNDLAIRRKRRSTPNKACWPHFASVRRRSWTWHRRVSSSSRTTSSRPVWHPTAFDAIVSFEVLEHRRRSGGRLRAMARLLRPGGIAYHDYNPFFASTAGIRCARSTSRGVTPAWTIDDFERYLREIRPTRGRPGAALLSRESQPDDADATCRPPSQRHGLEIVAVIPWMRAQH